MVTQHLSCLWHSHQMVSTLSQVHNFKQFVCGMPQKEIRRQAHISNTWIQSHLRHCCQTVGVVSHQAYINFMLNTTAGNTETTRHVDFTDHSVVNKEGWICGRNGELLIWIPETHRANLHHPSNIWVAGKNETRLDLSTFVHGRRWASCISA